jgi:uncharacterized protein (UPF0276 family)
MMPLQDGYGVGVMYNPAIPQFLHAHPDSVDYVEITSDMFWTDHGPQHSPRFEYLESWIDTLDRLAVRYPLVAHNIGLSIGSAGPFDAQYVEHLAEWLNRYDFRWHSDHLAFSVLRADVGADHSVGIAAPLPFDVDVLEMVAERARLIQAQIALPFLLENGVQYVVVPDQDLAEHEFLNALAARSDCRLLLDLHNLYVNARNLRFDPFGFIDRLALQHVHEVHIAGGTEFAGLYTDSHSGPCPPTVWELLDYLIPRAPELQGVTFEFHDSYFATLGNDGILKQLETAREIVARHPHVSHV